MDEHNNNKVLKELMQGHEGVGTIERPQGEEAAEAPRSKKPRKHTEERSGLGIAQKVNFATHRTLSTTERLIKSLTNAYEHIFVGDTTSRVNFDKDQGFRYFSKGDHQKALGHFESYVQAGNTNDAEILHIMAVCLVREDQHKKAIEYYERADALKPNDYDIITEFAGCLLALEKYDDALNCLKKAIVLNPEEPDLYYHCATCYEKNDQTEEAKKMYKKAIDLNPREAVYYHALGFVYENTGDHKDAIVCFKKAMDAERERGGGGDRSKEIGEGMSAKKDKFWTRKKFQKA